MLFFILFDVAAYIRMPSVTWTLKLPDWAGLGEGLAIGDGDGEGEGEDGGVASANVLISRLRGAWEACVATVKAINARGLVVVIRVLAMFFIISLPLALHLPFRGVGADGKG